MADRLPAYIVDIIPRDDNFLPLLMSTMVTGVSDPNTPSTEPPDFARQHSLILLLNGFTRHQMSTSTRTRRDCGPCQGQAEVGPTPFFKWHFEQAFLKTCSPRVRRRWVQGRFIRLELSRVRRSFFQQLSGNWRSSGSSCMSSRLFARIQRPGRYVFPA